MTFGTQAASGSYTMVIGPNILDTSGNPMNQDGDTTNGEATQDRYTATTTWFVSGPQVTGSTFSGTANFSINKLRLTFDRAIDPATFTSADVASFTGPDGTISSSYTIAAVSGSGNTQFDVTLWPTECSRQLHPDRRAGHPRHFRQPDEPGWRRHQWRSHPGPLYREHDSHWFGRRR